MLSALQFARFAAFMEYDFEDTVQALVEDYGMSEQDARDGLRTAIRERQEKDLADSFDEIQS